MSHRIRSRLWSAVVGSAFASFALVALVALVALAGCAQNEKRTLEFDTARLLKEDLLQGWSLLEKAPPVVGEFDVTFFESAVEGSGAAWDVPSGEALSPRPPYTGAIEGECNYIEEVDRIVVVCPGESDELF
jgi:hypothetical protein